MEFIKQSDKFIIMVDGKQIGTIYKDEKRNYNFNHVIQFNFEIKGYINSAARKNWKQAKQEAERLYNSLMDIHKRYGKEIIKTC